MPISKAIIPLRLIFWGALLAILDFSFSYSRSVNGGPAWGFRFDVLNDFVGMLLVTGGVYALWRFDVHPRYRRWMGLVFYCGVANSIEALADHFIFPRPAFIGWGSQLLGMATLVATVLFSSAMIWLCQKHELRRSRASWERTRLFVMLLWVLPLGVMQLLGMAAPLLGLSFSFNLGLLGIPLLLLMLVPLVHLFISTSRMRREAAEVSSLDAAVPELAEEVWGVPETP
jgi:hypothetical protein